MIYPIYEEVIFMLAFIMGLTVLSYKNYAEYRKWPVGRLYNHSSMIIYMPALVACIFAIAGSLFVVPWWSIFITIFGGFLVSLSITNTLKSYIQPIAAFGTYVMWFWSGCLLARHWFD